jgi:uncharacterized membrane protein YfcA
LNPPPLDFLHTAVALAAAFAAGLINSIAGGGTFITFPTLIWLGLTSVSANATSTVVVWPGVVGTTWGYQREVRSADRRMLTLAVPSVVGGLAGALLLHRTPASVFDVMVPFLILFATLLFMIQEPIQRKLKTTNAAGRRSTRWLAGAAVFQLGVALYGGYFGAGIGILMLAAMSVLGLTDIHQMNGLRAFFGASINGVAALYFIWEKMVYWPYVLIMVLGAIAGGYLGAHGARRIGQRAVRRIVIGVGFAMTLALLIKR